jgi:ribosomal 50S subunit-associated protein YjgA (DUF615 family)
MNFILQDCIFASKTQNKKYFDLLYSLGVNIVNSSHKVIKSLNLPEELKYEIESCQKNTNGNARKRQQQFIAKMLREYEWNYDDFLVLVKLVHDKSDKILLLAQIWFSKLISAEIAAEDFINVYNVRDLLHFSHVLSETINNQEKYDDFLQLIKKILSQYVF